MTKVTLYINDKVWDSYKSQVFLKYGNLRKLSCDVESLLREAVVERQAVSAFETLGIKVKGTVSSQEIKALRPKLKGSSSQEIVREMRGKRVAQTLS